MTNDFDVGNGGEGGWLYQFSHSATLWNERMHATLTFGVNLAIHNLKSEKGELHDIYASVLTAVGYILHPWTAEGKDQATLLWGEHGEFRYGQPDEATVITRFHDGLRGSLTSRAS